MIERIRLRNFVIFDDLSISFHEGFTAITGETGSGKSLLLSTLSLIGTRTDSSVVGLFGDEAVVEVVFNVENNVAVKEILKEAGIEVDDFLIMRRIISSTGKSRVFINDSPATLKLSSKLLGQLVEIQSQREGVRLLNPVYQLEILDAFGKLLPLRKKFADAYKKLSLLKAEFKEMEENRQELLRRIDYLNYAISEIESINPSVEEEKVLLEERNVLMNLEKIKGALDEVGLLLSEGEYNALSFIKEAIYKLRKIEGLDERKLLPIVSSLEQSLTLLEDVIFELGRYASSLDMDPSRIEEVERRLAEFSKLKRKYGESIEEVLSFYKDALREREEIEDRLVSSKNMEGEIRKLEALVEEIAQELSKKRREAAEKLSEKITELLGELGFDEPIFEVSLVEGECSSSGKDICNFLFSSSQDMQPKPLFKVASGGELSRILLALKLAFSEIDRVETIIFDEVDTGIGGRIADMIGEKLKELGGRKQVIAITHFPQIAMRAHYHLKVERVLKEGKTSAKVFYISGKERKDELERMVGDTVKIVREVQQNG